MNNQIIYLRHRTPWKLLKCHYIICGKTLPLKSKCTSNIWIGRFRLDRLNCHCNRGLQKNIAFLTKIKTKKTILSLFICLNAINLHRDLYGIAPNWECILIDSLITHAHTNIWIFVLFFLSIWTDQLRGHKIALCVILIEFACELQCISH